MTVVKSTRLILAAVQMKFRSRISENADFICETIESSAREGTDVILFPECALTGYRCDFAALSMADVEVALQRVRRAARRNRCHVLLGSPTWTRGKCFNSLLVINRGGRESFRYSKIHLTSMDRRWFVPGNSLAYFRLDQIACTSIICHERRYPELVRLPVMMGAQIVFHPNAGLDALPVSKQKRGGRDGIAVRAFENEVYYVFANSVGPQGDGLWSAGDSKIVAPDSRVLALANNRDETIIQAEIDVRFAGRKYAREALVEPAFLRASWKRLLSACRRQLIRSRSGRGV